MSKPTQPDMREPHWRRGLVWKDGKLYAFEHHSILVMRMWPEMRAWRRTKTKPWAATRRYADERLSSDLLTPGEIERYALFRTQFGGPIRWDDCFDRTKLDYAAALSAFQTIPDRERNIAAQFKHRRWHALAMMARCPGATDLLEANPALGYMLANSWVMKRAKPTQPMRAARAILRKPQADILSWLDLPGTERVRRILQKVRPDALRGEKLPLLQRALWKPELQSMLAHLPYISYDVLRFIQDADSASRLTPRFLAEVANQAAQDGDSGKGSARCAVGLWGDAIRMARYMGLPCVEKLHSVGQLQRWHDSVVRDYNRFVVAPAQNQTEGVGDSPQTSEAFGYGLAPFCGTTEIRPLQTFGELLREGVEMGHCVASYHHAIASGSYFVYRVEQPARATLGLIRHRGAWTVDQMLVPRNRRLDPLLQQEVWASLSATAPCVNGNPLEVDCGCAA